MVLRGYYLVLFSIIILTLLTFNCSEREGGPATTEQGEGQPETEELDADNDGIAGTNEEQICERIEDQDICLDPGNYDTDGDELGDGEEYNDGIESTNPLIFNGFLGKTYKITTKAPLTLCKVRDLLYSSEESSANFLELRETKCLSNPDSYSFGGGRDFRPSYIEGFGEASAFSEDDFIVRYQGELFLSTAKEITFTLSGIDNSAIIIVDNKAVAAYLSPSDGIACRIKTNAEPEATVALEAGSHPIDIIFYEKRGNVKFQMQIAPAGTSSSDAPNKIIKTMVQSVYCTFNKE